MIYLPIKKVIFWKWSPKGKKKLSKKYEVCCLLITKINNKNLFVKKLITITYTLSMKKTGRDLFYTLSYFYKAIKRKTQRTINKFNNSFPCCNSWETFLRAFLLQRLASTHALHYANIYKKGNQFYEQNKTEMK